MPTRTATREVPLERRVHEIHRRRIARVERTSRSNNSTSTYIATEMHIAGKIFTVPDAAFPELEDGAMYAVHYWEGTDEVFSVERV